MCCPDENWMVWAKVVPGTGWQFSLGGGSTERVRRTGNHVYVKRIKRIVVFKLKRQKQRRIQCSFLFAREVNANEGENSLQPTGSNDSRTNMDNFFTGKLRLQIKISKHEKTMTLG